MAVCFEQKKLLWLSLQLTLPSAVEICAPQRLQPKHDTYTANSSKASFVWAFAIAKEFRRITKKAFPSYFKKAKELLRLSELKVKLYFIKLSRNEVWSCLSYPQIVKLSNQRENWTKYFFDFLEIFVNYTLNWLSLLWVVKALNCNFNYSWNIQDIRSAAKLETVQPTRFWSMLESLSQCFKNQMSAN